LPLAAEDEPLEELARRQGVRPVESVDAMAGPGLFDSDEEWQEFLADLYTSRHVGLSVSAPLSSTTAPRAVGAVRIIWLSEAT
jgi:hypothetical protein